MSSGSGPHHPGEIPSRVPPPSTAPRPPAYAARAEILGARSLRLIPGELADSQVGTIGDLLEALTEAGHLTRQDIRSWDGRLIRHVYQGTVDVAPDTPGPVVTRHWGQPDQGRPPNEVDVDEDGCSCHHGTLGGFRPLVDPACPTHGEGLGPDDGDVLVRYPDGREIVLPPPGLFPRDTDPDDDPVRLVCGCSLSSGLKGQGADPAHCPLHGA